MKQKTEKGKCETKKERKSVRQIKTVKQEGKIEKRKA